MFIAKICSTFVSSKKVKMEISKEIISFATDRPSFSRKEVMKKFDQLSEKSLSQQLYRLVKNNRLKRVRQGVYCLPVSLFPVSNELKQLNELLKTQFPFTNFCLWSSDVLLPFMHHIPNLNFIYVNVENDAAESVFSFLNENQEKRIFFRPAREDFYRYIAGKEAIIICHLITESPLQKVENVSVPSFEKIMVDIVGDVEFEFLQDMEITYFYQNVMERHKINKNKLLRYASRRGRRQKVEQLYNNAI